MDWTKGGWILRTEVAFGCSMEAGAQNTSSMAATLGVRGNALMRGDPNVLEDAPGDEGPRER
jgi:hypothetical protein